MQEEVTELSTGEFIIFYPIGTGSFGKDGIITKLAGDFFDYKGKKYQIKSIVPEIVPEAVVAYRVKA
jgi:hypothetical protein